MNPGTLLLFVLAASCLRGLSHTFGVKYRSRDGSDFGVLGRGLKAAQEHLDFALSGHATESNYALQYDRVL